MRATVGGHPRQAQRTLTVREGVNPRRALPRFNPLPYGQGSLKTRRPGLTLLEVLVALAIFLMSLVAIAGLVDFGAERGQAAAMQSVGTRLAQSKLAEAEAGAIGLTGSGETGEFDTEPGWNYTVESTPSGPANVFAVTVTCWRELNGRRYEVKLSQVLCDPAQMGTATAATPPDPATTSGGSR